VIFADNTATVIAADNEPTGLVLTAFAMLFSLGLAGRGWFKGDGFVAGSVVTVALLVGIFTFFPVVKILISAVEGSDGAFSPAAFFARLTGG